MESLGLPRANVPVMGAAPTPAEARAQAEYVARVNAAQMEERARHQARLDAAGPQLTPAQQHYRMVASTGDLGFRTGRGIGGLRGTQEASPIYEGIVVPSTKKQRGGLSRKQWAIAERERLADRRLRLGLLGEEGDLRRDTFQENVRQARESALSQAEQVAYNRQQDKIKRDDMWKQWNTGRTDAQKEIDRQAEAAIAKEKGDVQKWIAQSRAQAKAARDRGEEEMLRKIAEPLISAATQTLLNPDARKRRKEFVKFPPSIRKAALSALNADASDPYFSGLMQ